MAQRIDSLSTVSTISNSYLMPISEFDITSYNITFEDFKSNLNKIRATGSDLSIGSDTDSHAITVKQTTKRVGIGSFYGPTNQPYDPITPLFDLEVAGTSGSDVYMGLRPQDVNQSLYFYSPNASYGFRKNTINDFWMTGEALTFPPLYFHSGSGTFISDGFGYEATGCDTDTNIQIYAQNNIRTTINDGTNSKNINFTSLGIQSDGDLDIDFFSGNNAATGTRLGLSGAVFVSSHNQNTRIGNIERFPVSRLEVTNAPTENTTYRTQTLIDYNFPNLFFQKSGSNLNTSLTFDGVNTLYFGRNKSPSSYSNADGVIFNLSSKKVSIGGNPPVYSLDVSGNSLANRFSSVEQTLNLVYSLQRDPVSGPVQFIRTSYKSGNKNQFYFGCDFERKYMFINSGDNTDNYIVSQNTHMFDWDGNLDIKGSYTTNSSYSKGKFTQNYQTQCRSSNIYINPFNPDSTTDANAGVAGTGNPPYGLAPFAGQVEKIKIVTADTSLTHFTAGARFEISIVDASSGGVDGELDCFSSVAASAPVTLPSNGVVAQFALTSVNAAGTVFTFETWSGNPTFQEGQLVQYRICQVGGSATDINSTIMSTVSYTVD